MVFSVFQNLVSNNVRPSDMNSIIITDQYTFEFHYDAELTTRTNQVRL